MLVTFSNIGNILLGFITSVVTIFSIIAAKNNKLHSKFITSKFGYYSDENEDKEKVSLFISAAFFFIAVIAFYFIFLIYITNYFTKETTISLLVFALQQYFYCLFIIKVCKLRILADLNSNSWMLISIVFIILWIVCVIVLFTYTSLDYKRNMIFITDYTSHTLMLASLSVDFCLYFFIKSIRYQRMMDKVIVTEIIINNNSDREEIINSQKIISYKEFNNSIVITQFNGENIIEKFKNNYIKRTFNIENVLVKKEYKPWYLLNNEENKRGINSEFTQKLSIQFIKQQYKHKFWKENNEYKIASITGQIIKNSGENQELVIAGRLTNIFNQTNAKDYNIEELFGLHISDLVKRQCERATLRIEEYIEKMAELNSRDDLVLEMGIAIAYIDAMDQGIKLTESQIKRVDDIKEMFNKMVDLFELINETELYSKWVSLYRPTV